MVQKKLASFLFLLRYFFSVLFSVLFDFSAFFLDALNVLDVLEAALVFSCSLHNWRFGTHGLVHGFPDETHVAAQDLDTTTTAAASGADEEDLVLEEAVLEVVIEKVAHEGGLGRGDTGRVCGGRCLETILFLLKTCS